MARRFISQLGERENVDEVYLASEKQLRANRNGNLYLQLRLADRTGSLTAMMWNANDHIYRGFENGDYLRVQGVTQFYNGTLQIIASRIERLASESIDESDFATLSSADIDRLAARLSEMLRSVADQHLRGLAECFLVDESIMENFVNAPAGVKNHHAYRGGLLEHVVNLMELASLVAGRYPEIDGDLLTLGAFLHDLGKVRELTYERELGYSDEGQLIGHMVIAAAMLDDKVREAQDLLGEPFPDELALRLKHMIVSHHGEYEYGSPKLPMTPEAIALHYLDNLDAKLHAVAHLIRTDANTDSNWTPYQSGLGRKLYKGDSAPANGGANRG
jgi:3'-5' exoribonuclease